MSVTAKVDPANGGLLIEVDGVDQLRLWRIAGKMGRNLDEALIALIERDLERAKEEAAKIVAFPGRKEVGS